MIKSPSDLTAEEKRQFNQWLDTMRRLKEGVKPIPKESPGKKKKRIEHLLKPGNDDDFIEYYYATDDFTPSAQSWFLKEFEHAFWVEKQRKIVLEVHREGGKSITVNIKTPMKMMALGELTGMILAGETFDKAKDQIKDLETQLRINKRFAADFFDGNVGITGSWIQGYFQTRNYIPVWCFGLGQNPAGVKSGFVRPNLGMVDDADNYKKTESNPQWAKQNLKWINGEFMGCLAKDNRHFIYCNNRIHKAGLTAHIVGDVKEDDEVDPNIKHIKAYLTEDPKTHQPIYPEGRTYDVILKNLKAQGAVPAWKEYYSLEDCVAKIVDYGITDALRQLYHKHEVEGTMFDDENMPWVDPLPLSSYDAIVDYCDPAFGEAGKGSHKAIIRMGKKDHYYDILKVWLRTLGQWWEIQYDWANQIAHGVKVSENTHVVLKEKVKAYKSYVECNSLQKTELRKTYKLANLNRDVPWYPTYDTDRKGNKEARIESTFETIMNEGHVRFSNALRKNGDMITLRDQFKGFPFGNIDGPDAAQGAKEKLDRMDRSYKTQSQSGTFNKNKKKVG